MLHYRRATVCFNTHTHTQILVHDFIRVRLSAAHDIRRNLYQVQVLYDIKMSSDLKTLTMNQSRLHTRKLPPTNHLFTYNMHITCSNSQSYASHLHEAHPNLCRCCYSAPIKKESFQHMTVIQEESNGQNNFTL